jgi:hypothetical protein
MTDINRYRGDTLRIGAVVKQNKKIMNVTSYTFKLTVNTLEDPPDDTTQLFQSDGVIVDAVNGKIYFPLTENQVNTIGNYFFDIQMIDPNGEKKTLDKGQFNLTQDITKV